MNTNQIKVLFGAMTLLSCQYVLAQDSDARWWQRETLQPSTRQVINPRYVTKKRELEKSWDEYQNNIRAEKHFRSMGQKTNALRGAVKESERVINQIQHELETIRPYITNIRKSKSITGRVQTTPLELSIILNEQKRPPANSSGLPSSTIPPSQWYDRVVDELLNLLPEDSQKATERIRLVLLLVPEEYDYTKDRIIVKGVQRVLKSEIAKILEGIPALPTKPVRLILGSGDIVCTSVEKGYGTNRELRLHIPGTKIVYADAGISTLDDGSERGLGMLYLWRGLYDDMGWRSPTPREATEFINGRWHSTIPHRDPVDPQPYREMILKDARKKFERAKRFYEERLKAFAEVKDKIFQVGPLLDQLWILSGDSKWIADKTRIHNDMVRVLEREGYLEKQKLSGGDLKTKK